MRKGQTIKVVLAPDKFKGTLTAPQVCEAIRVGLQHNQVQIISIPLADGGEGSLTTLNKGEYIQVRVADPLFRKIITSYRYDHQSRTAFIEIAKASGLSLLKPEERDCRKTTSYGTGELISHALTHYPKHIYLFLGGSATNDAGIGMAGALGFTFIDKENNLLPSHALIGENLIHINKVHPPPPLKSLSKTKFLVVSDVKNPLFGNKGAAYVFAPQKGADLKIVKDLDRGLRNIGRMMGKISSLPGSGAAGGLGAGALYFLQARQIMGVDFFIEQTDLESKLHNVNLVISGEGSLDAQTWEGKVISGISELLKKKKKKIPFVVIVGQNHASTQQIQSLSIDKVYSLSEIAGNDRAFRDTAQVITEIAEEIKKNFKDIKVDLPNPPNSHRG